MSDVLATIAPVFALILLGYLAARFKLLSGEAARGLAEFIFAIAMPALLFRTMVTSAPVEGAPLAIIASFYIADAAIWVLASVGAFLLLKSSRVGAASIAMAASFGNTVMVGLPLGLSYFGKPAGPILALVIAFHAPALWIIATLQAEWSGSRAEMSKKLGSLAVDLAKNPIVAGVVLGGLWRITGFGLPSFADRTLELLGLASIPGALFSLGMGLTKFRLKEGLPAAAFIGVVKLLILPLTTFGLARAFALPPLATAVVVLLAACPTGANAYIFAERYKSEDGAVSGAVALTTVVSVVTISLVLLFLGQGLR